MSRQIAEEGFSKKDVNVALGVIGSFVQLNNPHSRANCRWKLKEGLYDALYKAEVSPILIELIKSDLPKILKIDKDKSRRPAEPNSSKVLHFAPKKAQKKGEPTWRQEFLTRFVPPMGGDV